MKVELESWTTNSEGLSLGEYIAYVARVSNPTNQHNTETSSKLLKYLIKHKHWSPFEMASVCMKITTTRDIAHQILRHRSFSFQEFSQRYAKAMGSTLREARLQDVANRQNSIDTANYGLQVDWLFKQEQVINLSNEVYNWALEQGIAKEVARAVLPEGLTDTALYMSGTVRSWIHYIMVRTDPSTQKEHREVALAARAILAELIDLEL